jgi:hypothetical protein
MSDIGEWLVVILYVLAIVIGAVYLVASVIRALVESEDAITVEERIGAHGESGIYLIMTEEGGDIYDPNRQKAHDFSRGMNAVRRNKIHNYLWYTPNI